MRGGRAVEKRALREMHHLLILLVSSFAVVQLSEAKESSVHRSQTSRAQSRAENGQWLGKARRSNGENTNLNVYIAIDLVLIWNKFR